MKIINKDLDKIKKNTEGKSLAARRDHLVEKI